MPQVSFKPLRRNRYHVLIDGTRTGTVVKGARLDAARAQFSGISRWRRQKPPAPPKPVIPTVTAYPSDAWCPSCGTYSGSHYGMNTCWNCKKQFIIQQPAGCYR